MLTKNVFYGQFVHLLKLEKGFGAAISLGLTTTLARSLEFYKVLLGWDVLAFHQLLSFLVSWKSNYTYET
tara:strand:+ start:49 stop:258 length:210 start_codon:yes stop_codon:yes gene_type:complete